MISVSEHGYEPEKRGLIIPIVITRLAQHYGTPRLFGAIARIFQHRVI